MVIHPLKINVTGAISSGNGNYHTNILNISYRKNEKVEMKSTIEYSSRRDDKIL